MVQDNDYFDMSPRTITFGSNETSKTVNIDSNCYWEIKISKTNWPKLTVEPVSGNGKLNNLRITSDENTTTSARSATLNVVFGANKQRSNSFIVTQDAGDAFLKVSPDSYEFSGDGGNNVFTIDTNSDWRVDKVTNNEPEWCKLDKKEGKSGQSQLTVTVDENPNITMRESQIMLLGAKPATITIRQKGKDYSLTLGTDNVTVDARGGEDMAKTFTVTCNGSWSTTVKHDDGGSWCSVSPSYGGATGANPLNVKVVCQPNYATSPRYATIKVVAGNNAKEAPVKVTQEAATYPVFSGVPTCREISSTKQEVTISFTSMFEVTECGFCLGTGSQPTTRYKMEGMRGTSGTIKMELDVEEGTSYYVRAYAVSPVGEKINYSEETKFDTKGNQPGKDDNTSPNV